MNINEIKSLYENHYKVEIKKEHELFLEVEKEIETYRANRNKAFLKFEDILPKLEKMFNGINFSLVEIKNVVLGWGGNINKETILKTYVVRSCSDKVLISGYIKYNGLQLKPTEDYKKAGLKLEKIERKFMEKNIGIMLRLNSFSIKRNLDEVLFELHF